MEASVEWLSAVKIYRK